MRKFIFVTPMGSVEIWASSEKEALSDLKRQVLINSKKRNNG